MVTVYVPVLRSVQKWSLSALFASVPVPQDVSFTLAGAGKTVPVCSVSLGSCSALHPAAGQGAPAFPAAPFGTPVPTPPAPPAPGPFPSPPLPPLPPRPAAAPG